MTASLPELTALRRVKVADVYKKGRHAARLRRAPHGNEFAYDEGYDGSPVASTLPLSDPPTTSPAGAVPPFFAGLLPEGRRLSAIQRATKTSADDDLTLLLAVGRDTIGDVQVVPADEDPTLPPPVVHDDLTRVSFRELFARATGDDLDRVGIPGFQAKVSVSQMLSFPVGVGEGRYILKLNPAEYPSLVENEAFFLEQAHACGLTVAETRVVHDREGDSGLLVKRFDRVVTEDGLRLLAQEDACQACGRYPADKYNLSTEEALIALARLTAAPKVALLELVQQVAFAYLTGNGDMHAKNLSVVEYDGEMRAAPGYDMPSTHPYGDTTMAMSIDGKDRENITRRSMLHLAKEVGLPRRAAETMLNRLLRRFAAVVDSVDRLPFGEKVRHKLRRLMKDRAGKLG